VGARARSGFLLAAALAAACGGGKQAGTPQGVEEKVLHVYNWADYIGSTTLSDFEARTGIKVVYDTYDANEVLETKLLAGHTGYDVVVPSSTFLARQVKAGVYRKLDKSLLPNLAHMDPEVMRQVALSDPGNQYAIAYTWGTLGIGYNPGQVRKAIGTDRIDSWGAIFDPAVASGLSGCGIALLDAPEDVFNAALIYIGRDPNSERAEDLAAAEAVLVKVAPYVRYYNSMQSIGDLASGEICVALTWNGFVNQARSRGRDAKTPVRVEYALPREGSTAWYDTMAIPADAPHPGNAHAFLNFMMDPQVIAAVTRDTGYANGNAASLEYLDAKFRNDAAVYPPADVLANLQPNTAHSQEYSRELNRAWTRIKTGQ
jgi:putrescine transport system substrate-binding protein